MNCNSALKSKYTLLTCTYACHSHLCLYICGYYLSIIVNITDYNYYKNTTTNIIIIN